VGGVFLRRAAIAGLRKGFSDGSRPWMALGVVAGLVILARRVGGQEPELIAREVLQPGERVVVKVGAATE
jgi:hypothetical protein